jgi:hypothetical protein
MPTAWPRHSITETPAIAAVLDNAARVWPDLGDRRSELLRRVIEVGGQTVAATAAQVDRESADLIEQLAGSMPNAWPASAAQALKDEWPS